MWVSELFKLSQLSSDVVRIYIFKLFDSNRTESINFNFSLFPFEFLAALGIYFWLVIYSYRQELKEQLPLLPGGKVY